MNYKTMQAFEDFMEKEESNNKEALDLIEATNALLTRLYEEGGYEDFNGNPRLDVNEVEKAIVVLRNKILNG
jgi:hypothetical protein